MPVTRRKLIKNGLTFVSLGTVMPSFLVQAAEAVASQSRERKSGLKSGIPEGKILVVVEMSGGNDGLNTVVPFRDAQYLKMRPVIGIPEAKVIKIDSKLGLHPGMTSLGDLINAGHAAVVAGVGYPNPNRSHFQSMDIWQTGNPAVDATERSGWMARYFDADGHYQGNPLSGVTLGSSLPLAMWTQTSPVSVIGNGADFGFGRDGRGPDQFKQLASLRSLYAQGTSAGSNLEFIRNVGNDVYTSTEEIKQALHGSEGKANAAAYPNNNGLAARLQTIGKLINGGLGTRVYYANIGGFDTHADQPNHHAGLLNATSEALAAFYRDLSLQGREKDVLVMTFSEFGRRTQENGSAGTDHGAASVMFLMGGALRGGIHGQYPSLSDLDGGDLRFTTDFRSVYATIIDKWLAAPSTKVLGKQFPHLNFV